MNNSVSSPKQAGTFFSEDQDIEEEVKKLDNVARHFSAGEQIQRLMLTQNEEKLNKALILICREKEKVNKNRFKRWIFLVVGMLLGLAFSKPTMYLLQVSGFSFYSRVGLD